MGLSRHSHRAGRASHPGNIGAVARAMKNMALSELLLVQRRSFRIRKRPRAPRARTTVLAGARVVASLAEALEGCGFVAASTSRDRDQYFRVIDVRAAAVRIVAERAARPRRWCSGPSAPGSPTRNSKRRMR